jgi:Fe-S oxidoreductase
MKPDKIKISDFSCQDAQLCDLDPTKFTKLPYPYEDWVDPPFPKISEAKCEKWATPLDGVLNPPIPKNPSDEEKAAFVKKFIEGLKKTMSADDNWTFYKTLMLSLDNCVKCNTCADACPVFESSGRAEIYRPLYKADIFRRIIRKYTTPGGKVVAKLTGSDINLTYESLARLLQMSYRCMLCRRCAQTCPMGVDNGLISREIRKIFSMEMDMRAPELHEEGSIKQLETGSSTGLGPLALMDIIEFCEEDITERTGLNIKIPFDVPDADILLVHNAGEFLSWPENIEAFAILFELAGLKWTLSSDLVAYDSVNYGLFYDDVQYARITLTHAEAAKKLNVKKVVVGECGHAHKAMMPIGDRIWLGESNIPRESCMATMEDIVMNEKVMVDPERNYFPCTYHDPCNIARSMGIIEPPRRILSKIAPKFREMTPHGVNNYCCGGGSGFAIMQSDNFPAWRNAIAGRKKFSQYLNAFTKEEMFPDVDKYLITPCSNCKGQTRDLLTYFDAYEKTRMLYGGLVEMIINCMTDVKEGFIEFDDFH